MKPELNQFVDKILEGTGLTLSPEKREELANKAVEIIIGRSLATLSQTFASTEDMEKIDAYAKAHTPEETWSYLVAEIPEFESIFGQQLNLYFGEFQALAKAIQENQ
jgi:hypothetical protein